MQTITVDGTGTSVDQVMDYAYNGYGLLTNATASGSGGGASYGYTSDAAANVTSEQKATTTTRYGYDRAGQLCWQGPTTGTLLNATCPATPPAGNTEVPPGP